MSVGFTINHNCVAMALSGAPVPSIRELNGVGSLKEGMQCGRNRRCRCRGEGWAIAKEVAVVAKMSAVCPSRICSCSCRCSCSRSRNCTRCRTRAGCLLRLISLLERPVGGKDHFGWTSPNLFFFFFFSFSSWFFFFQSVVHVPHYLKSRPPQSILLLRCNYPINNSPFLKNLAPILWTQLCQQTITKDLRVLYLFSKQ